MMNEKNIILNNDNLTVSKKNLKKALAYEGLDITLSKSANILAKTFGFKHEHELQQNLKTTRNDDLSLVEFYFDEMLSLFELAEYLIKKYRDNKKNIFIEGQNFFSDYILFKVPELISLFKDNRETIIKEGLNLSHFRLVRRIFNEVRLKKINKDNDDFYLFYLFYHYHNIEPYFLMDYENRMNYYFQPKDFEIDISNDHHDKFELSFAFDKQTNREVESYNKENGILIKRKIYSTWSQKIDVGSSFNSHSYTIINKK